MTNNFTPAKAGQQSKRLSKEEYAEKMKAEKEAVYQMADESEQTVSFLIGLEKSATEVPVRFYSRPWIMME